MWYAIEQSPTSFNRFLFSLSFLLTSFLVDLFSPPRVWYICPRLTGSVRRRGKYDWHRSDSGAVIVGAGVGTGSGAGAAANSVARVCARGAVSAAYSADGGFRLRGRRAVSSAVLRWPDIHYETRI